MDLNTRDQIYPTDIYRIFCPTAVEYIFFSSTHGTFSRIHILDHKTNLRKFKKLEIISSTFSDHNGMTLAINNKRKAGNLRNTWKLNDILLYNQCIKEEIKREKIHSLSM